jgi:hypothetical protein
MALSSSSSRSSQQTEGGCTINTIKSARDGGEENARVWDILEEVISEAPGVS